MGLIYTFHEDAMLPGLERLWREATDWGENTLDDLRPWFESAPFGKPSIVVANDERTGEMVGQFRFMPSRVSLDGRVVSAVRPFATIVTREAHEVADIRSTTDNPVVAMYVLAAREFGARGVGLIYIVPDQRWLHLFKRLASTLKMLRLNYGTFPLWSLPLPLESPIALGENFHAAPLAAWDEGIDARIDALWARAAQSHGCMMVRDAATLRWKLAQANYTTTVIERDGELVGLVAARRKGDRQWLICDLLAADAHDSMRATLAAAVNVAHAESFKDHDEGALRKVAMLVTNVIEPIVRDLGFARDDYDFPLAVQVLDQSIAAEDVALARWYVSAND